MHEIFPVYVVYGVKAVISTLKTIVVKYLLRFFQGFIFSLKIFPHPQFKNDNFSLQARNMLARSKTFFCRVSFAELKKSLNFWVKCIKMYSIFHISGGGGYDSNKYTALGFSPLN